MKSSPHAKTTTTKLLWATDLHLDRADPLQQSQLLDQFAGIEYDAAVITGDISSARYLRGHLLMLASACAPRPLHLVLGNHDYHDGKSLGDVDADVADLCASLGNLHYLNDHRIIPLGRGICLTGFGGWADARAGYGLRTVIDNPDHWKIRDFHGLNRQESLRKMRELGMASTAMVRKALPRALSRYRHVLVATHVPPFADAVFYNGQPCAPTHLPHFANLSAGLAIRAITRAFPKRRVTILCGHSHSASVTEILPNLSVRVGTARTGKPDVMEVLEFP